MLVFSQQLLVRPLVHPLGLAPPVVTTQASADFVCTALQSSMNHLTLAIIGQIVAVAACVDTSTKKNSYPPSTAGAINEKHRKGDPTTITTEAQARGLRLAASRLVKSRFALISSLSEGQELLALLKRHPDQRAAAVIGRHEQRLARTFARLDDVTNVLSAVEAALARLEGGVK